MLISENKTIQDELLVEMYEIIKIVLHSQQRNPTDEKKNFINYWLEGIEQQKLRCN